MNRRIKKKFDKRDGCKRYLNFRLHRIIKAVGKHITDDTDLIIITDSNRMDLKHPHQIRLLKQVRPVAMNDNKPEFTGEPINIQFNANTILNAAYAACLKGLQTNDTI
jgi:hypothetical protein